MNHYKVIFIITVFLYCTLGSCKRKKDPIIPTPAPPEQELITTIQLSFTDSAATSPTKYAVFRDKDGPGGTPYDRFDSILLEQNKTWFVDVLLLDESKSPADTVSHEIREKEDEHIFCYTFTGNNQVSVTVTDKDQNGLPVGLLSRWRTFGSGDGAMQVVLKHQPGKKDGTCNPGETDIEVAFPLKVQ